MDVQKKLDEVVGAVRSARSMPMSASCVVNRADLLDLLEEIRDALPGSLAQAEEVLGGREQVVEEARREAERIVASAHAERNGLVSATDVVRQAQAEADRILGEARREAEEIRAEADDYVDSKLANFEVVLTKTLGSVDRGREKLLGRGPGLDEQGYADEEAPEPTADPETLRERADAYVDAKFGAFEAVLSKTLDAVGRGRQKLHGRRAIDDLGSHLAAQEGVDHLRTSDADYLAGLAGRPGERTAPGAPAEPAAPTGQPGQAGQPGQVVPAGQDHSGAGRQGYQDPYAPAAAAYPQEPYGYQDAYQGGYQDGQQLPAPGYGYQDPYGQPQQGYGQGHGGQEWGHQQGGQDYAAAQYGQQPAPGSPAPDPTALDETSLFDTSVIDLDRLRAYEQGR
ncbi:cell division initiation protein [Streptomyces zingiberis]|uniref:Cell division initiation protein n=1 Tax=Streptomyces zingiberis TaxID=2053010 RepID=A0ABX1C3W5_9ACTN|nr:cell division initiation protein [Streptomyces zingiberis]NJQ02319.1 cell division initiation protein [Streptomyces zingiberis]